MDLLPFINKAGCECLNESDEHGFENCLRKDSSYLESDCDEQVQPSPSRALLGFTGFFLLRGLWEGWEGVTEPRAQSFLCCHRFHTDDSQAEEPLLGYKGPGCVE